ncbi:nuclear receptor coactivator 2-like, partial [Oncorhynchus masou masou]|uniref:nuclear receptor coactivator 2-like n=1 Tax=Oncorhynchus masou masou TaxID=90313 RepID=UPI00318407C7
GQSMHRCWHNGRENSSTTTCANASLEHQRQQQQQRTYGMSQQPHGGFGGQATPQSPLLSPRMAHAQSPMMQQQGNANFQASPDLNGWPPQGNMAGNSMFSTQQSPPQFTQLQQTNGGAAMYNGNGMNLNVSMATNASGMAPVGQMTGQMITSPGMTSMGQEQVRYTDKVIHRQL